MHRQSKLACLTVCTALLLGTTSFAAAQNPGTNEVNPAAVSAVQRMRAHLKSLESFEVRANATLEEPIDASTKVEFENQVRYDYRAPNRLFASWVSDRQNRRLYYDGRRLTLVSPALGYYASTEMTGSVAEVLQRASERFGIVFPLPDLFLWAWSSEPVQGVSRAVYVGPATIAGTPTDQYLFTQGDVDWQVWIQRGTTPFPRKIVITDRTDPANPSYSALLQWNPNVPLSDDHFAFAAPPGAGRIEMVRLGEGARP